MFASIDENNGTIPMKYKGLHNSCGGQFKPPQPADKLHSGKMIKNSFLCLSKSFSTNTI